MPARAIDSATIAFGLVSIPIKIYSTSEPSHEIHFHLIHEGCGERLRQFYECPTHGEVERDDMAKGYELSKGNFIELSKDELAALEAVSSGDIEIREFVPAAAIDPIFVDRTYFLGPDRGGERAYKLLHDALDDAGLVGVASYSARGKQYVVMVRPFESGLAMHQLRYRDEVKPWSEVPLGKLPTSARKELALAGQIVSQLEHETFDPAQYTDDVKKRVRELIATKVKGGEIVAPPEAPRPVVVDLVAALKASLEGGGAAPAADDHRVRADKPRTRDSHRKRASHATPAATGHRARGPAATQRGTRTRSSSSPRGRRQTKRAHT